MTEEELRIAFAARGLVLVRYQLAPYLACFELRRRDGSVFMCAPFSGDGESFDEALQQISVALHLSDKTSR